MDIGLMIGAEGSASASGGVFERTNPVTGEVATRAAAAKAKDAIAAVEAAAAAFPAWSKTGPSHRRKLLWKAADLLEARAPDFGKVVTAETGATAGWGAFNAVLAANMLREAAA